MFNSYCNQTTDHFLYLYKINVDDVVVSLTVNVPM